MLFIYLHRHRVFADKQCDLVSEKKNMCLALGNAKNSPIKTREITLGFIFPLLEKLIKGNNARIHFHITRKIDQGK